ncbi:MAG TPA: type II secretion system F family protein [Terriglobales bacterium]
MTVAIFIGLATLTFGVVMLLTRPTKSDRAARVRIAGVQRQSKPTVGGPETQEFLKNTSLSGFARLDRLLQRFRAAHELALLLAQAESTWNVSSVLISSAGLGLMSFAIVRYWIPDLLPSLVAGAAATVIPVLVLRLKRNRRLDKFNRNLPEALDLMSRSLRAGHSVSAAIEIVAEEGTEPLRTEFARVHQQQALGLPNRDALLQLGRRVPSIDLQVLITAMLVQKETGGNLVEILERTAAVLRDRLRIQGDVRIHTAQGRLTGAILCLLPFVLYVLINLANPGYTRVLIEDPVGRKITYAGIGMITIGGLLIRKIVRIKV